MPDNSARANLADYTITVRWLPTEKRWYVGVLGPDGHHWKYAGEEMRGADLNGARALMFAVVREIDSWLL